MGRLFPSQEVGTLEAATVPYNRDYLRLRGGQTVSEIGSPGFTQVHEALGQWLSQHNISGERFEPVYR